jgi:DNA-binding MarR family transcriptional regulator
MEKPADQSELAPGFVDNYLLYLLAAASHAVSADFHAHVRKAGLRVPEWRVIASLASQSPLRVTELAARTFYDQPRLTKTIARMAENGLVARSGDALDGRIVLVSLTAKGRAVARPLIAEARRHEEIVLADMAPKDRLRLKSFLKTFAAR